MKRGKFNYKDKERGQTTLGGPKFTKTLGQHILKNVSVIEKIIEKSEIRPTDIILEIGPGTGSLTHRLLEKGKGVIAIEKDGRLAAELSKSLASTPEKARKLKTHIRDALKGDFPYFDICVSNTPYQISSPLIFKLLEHKEPFRHAVLMFQREFAMRLVAKPGSEFYSRLSVNVQLLAKVEFLMKVPRSAFRPPPDVESCVVKIEPYYPPPPISFSEWDGMLMILFQRKNKTLDSNLHNSKVLELLERNRKIVQEKSQEKKTDEKDIREVVDEVLTSTDLTGKRSSKLGINDFLRLLCEFHKKDIHFA